MGYYDDYAFNSGSSWESLGVTILMIYLVILLILGLFALADYIIKGIGLYTIAKREGAEYPWLAFVPFARTYLQGEVAGEIVFKKRSIRNPGIWLLVIPIVESVAGAILYIATLGIIGLGIFGSHASVNSYSPGLGTGTIVMMITMLLVFIFVTVVFSAALQVLRVLVNHQIMGKFTSKNMSIVHAILMGVIPMYESICFLVTSRKPYYPGMEPPMGADPYPDGDGSVTPETQIQDLPVQPVQGNTDQETGFVPQRGLLNPMQPSEPEEVNAAETETSIVNDEASPTETEEEKQETEF